MKLFVRFKWSDKPEMRREQALIAAITFVSLIAYFKLKPYFESKSTVLVDSRPSDQPQTPKSFLEKLGLARTFAKSSISSGTSRTGIGYPAQSNSNRSKKALIERPLFDGYEAILTGSVSSFVSSLAPENPVEVSIAGLAPNQPHSTLDSSEIPGATLRGVLSPNFDKKRLNLVFSNLTTKEGRQFQVTGFAIDPKDNVQGIAAEYSSGLPRRLLGAVLGRTIVAGDAIGMSALMEGVTGQSPAITQLQIASNETNQQIVGEVSKEATSELRDTKPEMTLDVGTPVLVRVKSTQGNHP